MRFSGNTHLTDLGTLAVPLVLNDSTDWDSLAQEAQRLALQEKDPTTKAWLADVAAEYERLAKRAADRRASIKEG
jgi:hypothetical protein